MQLPLIDDARSVQKAISIVLSDLADGTLDATRARAILYGLQIAATNARHLASQLSPKPVEAIEPVESAEPIEPAAVSSEPVPSTPNAEDVAATPSEPEHTSEFSASEPTSEPEPTSGPTSEPVAEVSILADDATATAQPAAQHQPEEPAAPKPSFIFSDAYSYKSPHRERLLALRHRRPPVTL
jgi:hypothetical protein